MVVGREILLNGWVLEESTTWSVFLTRMDRHLAHRRLCSSARRPYRQTSSACTPTARRRHVLPQVRRPEDAGAGAGLQKQPVVSNHSPLCCDGISATKPSIISCTQKITDCYPITTCFKRQRKCDRTYLMELFVIIRDLC